MTFNIAPLKAILIFPVLALLASSCMKDDSEELKAKEDRLLKNYLITKSITATPRPSGLYFIPSRTGQGELPVSKDLVLVNYTVRDLSDAVLLTTYKSVAETNGLSTTGRYFGPERWIVDFNTNLMRGFMEGLSLMPDSSRATLITPSNIMFKQYGFSNIIGAYQTIVWDLEMVKVVKDPAAFERQLITAYLDTIAKDYDSTTDGLIKIIDKPGIGDLPATDTKVKVNFKLYLIEGYKVDEYSGYSYTIGNSSGTIPGWDKALRLVKDEEKCRVIIPFEQAWGEGGQGQIPPYATVVFVFERSE